MTRSQILTRLLITVTLALLVLPANSQAGLIVFGSHTDNSLVSGASLTDVRMLVELSVAGGVATFDFTNVSVSPEESAVFKRIVLDLADDDTATAVLWNGSVVTNTAGVSYTLEPYNVLPGYNPAITDGASMIQLEANPPPPTKGIGPAETLRVTFDTSLPDGSDIDDYLAFFDGGNDTAAYSIGFHAISADIVNGESLSGVYVPEPGTLALLVASGTVAIGKRRLRKDQP